MAMLDVNGPVSYRPPGGAMAVEAELSVARARAQLVRYQFAAPPEGRFRIDDTFRLEQCLTSGHKSARACFPDQWSTNRFERMGSLFLLPPGFNVMTRSDEDTSLSSIILELDADYVCELFDTLPSLRDWKLVAALDLRLPKLRNLLLRVAQETQWPGFASALVVEALALQAAIELLRHGNELGESHNHGGLASWQLRLIDERLREVEKAPTLTELAGLCRISVRHLARGFDASRGCTIGAYVDHNQIEHARRLLAMDHSVGTIAETLGFSGSSSFCFAFRRATDLTPGQYRKTLLRH